MFLDYVALHLLLAKLITEPVGSPSLPCMLVLQWLLNLFLLVSIHRLIEMKDWTEILRKALVLSLNTLIFILATALPARKQLSDLCMCLDLGKGRKWIYWVQNMNSPPKILSLSSAQAASAGLVHVNKEKKEWQHSSGVWSDSRLVRMSVLTQTERSFC